jgi:hypothetical protein
MRARERYWIVAALLGLAGAACGKTLDGSLSQQPGDAGPDGETVPPDAAPSEADDAYGGADVVSDAGPGVEAGTDASSVGEDAAGSDPHEADAAYSVDADATDSADAAEASIPISCDESTTCAAPIELPTIWGGVPAGVNETTNVYGEHSDWYLVKVEPYPPPAASDSVVAVNVFIEPPPGTEFDVAVYVSTSQTYPGTCSQAPYTSAPTGQENFQQVNLTFPNTSFTVLGWITIHVTAKPGTQCATGAKWWFQVTTG